MSIFTRSSGTAHENKSGTSSQAVAQEGSAEQSADFMPPVTAPRNAVPPGVVPPPAAPIYSMRPPRSTSAQEGVERSRAESVGGERELQARTQVGVEARIRVAAQRARAAQHSGAALNRAARSPDPQFDPKRAAATGLLKLAWSWQEAGSPIRAINAYVEVLIRYPGTAAADAAVADLVELSDILAAEGQFHTALAIYDHIEQWVCPEE